MNINKNAKPIPEFPGYEITIDGDVFQRKGCEITPVNTFKNRDGLAVHLRRDGKRFLRGLGKLLHAIFGDDCKRFGELPADAMPVPSFPGYFATPGGEVWSTRKFRPKKLIGAPSRKGYLCVCMHANGRSQSRFIHRIILETFVGPKPSGCECRHNPDPNPSNNRLENLRWGTPQENTDDKVAAGRQADCSGDKNGNSRLSVESVIDIKRLYKSGVSASFLAKSHSVSKTHIQRIVSRSAWRNVKLAD